MHSNPSSCQTLRIVYATVIMYDRREAFVRREKILLVTSAFLLSTISSMAIVPIRPVKAVLVNSMAVGMSGTDVHELQGRLKFLGYYHGTLSGSYSWQTYWAVRDFQYAFGLPIDGIAGPLTNTTLMKATSHYAPAKQSKPVTAPSAGSTSITSAPTNQNVTVPTSNNGISQNDINLMAHVVYGEARGQPFIGQIAVAAVIINRYHSSLFPHSIPGIIYQNGAFTSISNGQAWLGIHQQNVQAVMDAIHGFDPTHGALYYWNPATATSQWVWSQPVMLQIGNHVFAK